MKKVLLKVLLFKEFRVRILGAYVFKEFGKMVLLLLTIFVSMYLIFDLLRIEGFLKHGAELKDIIGYYVYKIPLIVSHTIAGAVLFAATFSLAALTKSNEITAMRASGISIYRIILPILGLAFLISLLTLLGNEYILPITNKKVEYIKKIKIQGEKPRSIFKNGRIWFRGDGGIIYNMQHIGPQQKALGEVTVYHFDSEFGLLKRIDASKAIWQGREWLFQEGSVYNFPKEGIPEYEKFDKKVISLKETPEDFKHIERNPQTMSFQELRNYVKDLESKGYEIAPYLVDMYAKLSIPFISLVMSIIGIPFALRLNRSGGKALGFAITLGLAFAYWVVLAMGLAVGHGGSLPPILAAWGANLLFAGLGFYLLGTLHY